MELDFNEVYLVRAEDEMGITNTIAFGVVEALDMPEWSGFALRYLVPRGMYHLGKPYEVAFGIPTKEEHRLILKHPKADVIFTFEPLDYSEWRAKYATEDEKLNSTNRDDMVQQIQLKSAYWDDWNELYGPKQAP